MLDIEPKKYTGNEKCFEKIAVAIKMSCRERNQRHLGLLLQADSTSPVKLLHLAWHNDLRLEEKFDNDYYCFQTCNGLMDDLIESFVDWLEILWQKNHEGIPYGLIFNEKDMIFGSNGEIGDLKPGQGFTCSSFVLECFKCYGLDLIKYNTWPVRIEDKDWAENIFFFLEKSACPEHVDAQRKNSNITRFRPEEVAAAATLNDFQGNTPLAFNDVEPLSKHIALKVS